MKLIKKVENYIIKKNMIVPHDRLCAGVSGGADSVCLLLLLSELREKMQFDLLVVHVNHGIRGKEADGDEVFVKNLCEKLKVPFKAFHVNVPHEARQRHLSEEEAGRCVRYEIFENVMSAEHLGKLALAHNMNDVAETLLHNEARGTSLQGLSSLRPIRGNIIRPLLGTSRNEIEEELKSRNLTWREDATNHEDDHTRNRIRHHILPEMENKVNDQAVRHLYELSETAAEISDFIREEAALRAESYLGKKDKNIRIKNELFENEKKPIKDEILFRAFEILTKKRRDIGRIHIESLYDLYEGTNGRRVSLPYGLIAEREAEGIFIRKDEKCGRKPPSEKKAISGGILNPGKKSIQEQNDLKKKKTFEVHSANEEISLRVPGTTIAGKWQINAEISDFWPQPIPEKPYTKWLDYAKMGEIYILRKRRAGDFLIINDKGNHKSFSNYCTDEKIPRSERDEIWLLASGSRIHWIIGRRMSADVKVSAETRRVLKLTVKEIE